MLDRPQGSNNKRTRSSPPFLLNFSSSSRLFFEDLSALSALLFFFRYSALLLLALRGSSSGYSLRRPRIQAAPSLFGSLLLSRLLPAPSSRVFFSSTSSPLSIAGGQNILGAIFHPSSLSGSLSSEAPHFFTNNVLLIFPSPACVDWCCGSPFLGLLSLPPFFLDRLTFCVRPPILHINTCLKLIWRLIFVW